MLKTRVLTAVILIPLVLAAMFGLGTFAWGAITLAIVAVGASEWSNLTGLHKNASLLFVAGTLLIGVVLLFLIPSGFAPGQAWPEALVLLVCGSATIFWLFVAPLWLYSQWRVESKLVLALLGWLVLLATWVAVVQMRAQSPGLLLAMMAIVWIADTAAYFAGRRFGRRKLAPSISPGKTWEGVYGAMLAVCIYASVLLLFAHDLGYTRELSVGFAAAWLATLLLLTALSVVGDLFESQLKRQRGIKDSGTILPGHGGVLDRIDALTAAMPAAALVSHYVIR
jgi:phosphatidate cytidylyltransferase